MSNPSGVDQLPILAVFGPSDSSSEETALAERVGAVAARAGWVLLTGGGPGVMEAASRGAVEAGGLTLAQDEESSLIYGMNKVATEAGWIRDVVPLKELAGRLISLWGEGSQGG